jgi:hypothetical protein
MEQIAITDGTAQTGRRRYRMASRRAEWMALMRPECRPPALTAAEAKAFMARVAATSVPDPGVERRSGIARLLGAMRAVIPWVDAVRSMRGGTRQGAGTGVKELPVSRAKPALPFRSVRHPGSEDPGRWPAPVASKPGRGASGPAAGLV